MHSFTKAQAEALELEPNLLESMLEVSIAFEPADGVSIGLASDLGYENLAHAIRNNPAKLCSLPGGRYATTQEAFENVIYAANRKLTDFNIEKSLSRAADFKLDLMPASDLPGLADLGLLRPHILWKFGNYLPTVDYVAVVGTRKATSRGRQLASDIVCALPSGWGLVSGGAVGIDSAAHASAIRFDKTQLVVLAGGLDSIYPPQSAAMLRGVTNGFLITERAPLMPTTGSDFLKRNRLIAALARKVVVVQAGLRSGSRNTFSHAQSLNREIFVAPGDVYDQLNQGSNLMLQEPGVSVLLSPDALFEPIQTLSTKKN